jgi:hypothetical protein
MITVLPVRDEGRAPVRDRSSSLKARFFTAKAARFSGSFHLRFQPDCKYFKGGETIVTILRSFEIRH